MIKGIYRSASGMLPMIKKQEISANNISNASTPGFKKDSLFTKELTRAESRMLPKKSDWINPMANKIFTDYTQGIFDKTGNPLDLAIDGEGFFALQLDNGERVLTRSGSFTVDENGLLSFPGGASVLGEGGQIEVGNGKVTVGQTGEIQSDGLTVGRIVPVTVNDVQELEKIGGSIYKVPVGTGLIPVQSYSIHQGFVETSNVDIVSEMINMIISFREYEANSKSIQSQDQSLNNLFKNVAGNG